MSGSTRPRTPGSIRAARHGATPIVAYRRDKTVGTHQPKFSGLNTFRVGFTRYLCTSPAFVPTHRRACYQSRRKARYWARGARLPRRDFHPLEHAALPGRTGPLTLALHDGHNSRRDLLLGWSDSRRVVALRRGDRHGSIIVVGLDVRGAGDEPKPPAARRAHERPSVLGVQANHP